MHKKVLNLYAGIGGNRKLWGDMFDITAVEIDPKIAEAYRTFYPGDTVVVGDAHDFLLENFMDYDFIWSSPPCPSHSQYRHNVGFKGKGFKAVYPEMALYEEIILLKHHFGGEWVVENTVSYYTPLIKPQKVSRHYVWANYPISDIDIPPTGIRDKNKISDLEKFLGYDLRPFKIPNKRQVLRNCVNPTMGRHILEQAGFVCRPTAEEVFKSFAKKEGKNQ